MTSMIKNIVIVGGGSAGWLTAGLIAAEHQSNDQVSVTLIESPDVPIVGVGEGTWPSMRLTLESIGIREADFIRHCGASFKQGSKFIGWVNGKGDDAYHHPFTEPKGSFEANLHVAWQADYSDRPFAEAVCVQPRICDAGRAPKQITTPEYASILNYGYHLDAGKFCTLLQEHCTTSLGVKHVLDNVTKVISAADGSIESVSTSHMGSFSGDLFIDCTGSLGLLIEKHFDVPLVSQKKFLFNDSALAIQVPYENEETPIETMTLSTAQKAGWIWDIGLSHRKGVGYVFSSSHTTDDQAESELRAYIANKTPPSILNNLSAKKIQIEPGYRQEFWHKNCVAVGQSAGFIEPLEASALVMVELSASMIAQSLPMTEKAMKALAKTFNRTFAYRWQRIVDFLKFHYVLSQRTDTPYWLDARSDDSTPKQLKDLLDIWGSRPPNQNDFLHSVELFPVASYLYILYGMGFKTDHHVKHSDNTVYGRKCLKDIDQSLERILSALPRNRELLSSILTSKAK